jgi:hypothetical protein
VDGLRNDSQDSYSGGILFESWPDFSRGSSLSRPVLGCHLRSVMVSVLAVGPKFRGFTPGRGDGFLKAIKIRSTPSIGGEVKPSAPCRKILRRV